MALLSRARSSERFLPNLKQQLEETERILEWARDNSATRQIEMNERVRSNLRNMIGVLEGGASLANIAERLDGGVAPQTDSAQLVVFDEPSARV